MDHTATIDGIRDLYVNSYGRKWSPKLDEILEQLVGPAPKENEPDTRPLKIDTETLEAIRVRMSDGAKAVQDLLKLS